MAKQLLGKGSYRRNDRKAPGASVAALKEKGVTPKLGIIRCGENPSDLSYERGATKRAEEIGVEVEKFLLPETVTKEELIAEIERDQCGQNHPRRAHVPPAAEASEGGSG